MDSRSFSRLLLCGIQISSITKCNINTYSKYYREYILHLVRIIIHQIENSRLAKTYLLMQFASFCALRIVVDPLEPHNCVVLCSSVAALMTFLGDFAFEKVA